MTSISRERQGRCLRAPLAHAAPAPATRRQSRLRARFSGRVRGRPARRALAAACCLLLFPSLLTATWSVVAVDSRTGQVIIASATCVPQGRFAGFPAKGLMDIQAIVVPGVGVAAAQAGVDGTRANQRLVYEEMKRGTAPALIIEMLSADPQFERRQFGIVDLQGRCAGHSGADNRPASLAVADSIPAEGIYFSVQGNILASDDVVHLAVAAFHEAAGGTMADRVMAAMEAADAAGGDGRCTCETEPHPEGVPCTAKTSHVAYLLVAETGDPEGESFNDGDYSLYIDVTDENIQPGEDANPVATLRMRYDRWKAGEG